MRERGDHKGNKHLCHYKIVPHLLTPLILMILLLSLPLQVKAENVILNKTDAYSYFINNPILNNKNITILNPSCDMGAIPLENGVFKWDNITINSYIMFEPKNSTTIITNSKLNNAIFTLREPSNLTVDHSLINFTADVVCENGSNKYYSNGVYIADDVAFDDTHFFNWVDNGGILDNQIIINNSKIIIEKSKPIVSAQNTYLYNTSNGAKTTNWQPSQYDEQKVIPFKNVILENDNITFINSSPNTWGGYSQFTKVNDCNFFNNASAVVYVSSPYLNLNYFGQNIKIYTSSPLTIKNNEFHSKATFLRSVDIWNTSNWQPIHIKATGGHINYNIFHSDLSIIDNDLDISYNVFNNSAISISGSNNILCHNTYYNSDDLDNCSSSSSGNEITGGFVGATGEVKNILIALTFVFLLVLFDIFTYEEKDINTRIEYLIIFVILFGLLASLIFIL